MGILDGQVALITGGARGQGRSHAVTLAKEGADIVLVDRCADYDSVGYPQATEADLAETVSLVEAEDRRCLAEQADVRDAGQLQKVVDQAVATLGRVDILLANAGISAGAPIQISTVEQWDDVVGTNLTGVFNSMRAVAPIMIGQGYGRIVATSSMMGRFATPAMAPYVASKWGVIGLVKCVAQDLAAFGITVNAVAPGNIDTPMIRNEWLPKVVRPDLEHPTLEDAAGMLGMLHVQPDAILPPSDVSAAILFLLGPGAAHMTGAVLDVSAGASARFTA